MTPPPAISNDRVFRQQLASELAFRQRANSRYSLRAFARFLDLDPSYLSKVIQGKRRVQASVLTAASRVLGWNLKNDPSAAELGARDSYRGVAGESFLLMSEWYHYAIFEYLKLGGREHTEEAVATALGLPLSAAKDALGTLLRLGYIRKAGGTYERSGRGITTTTNPASTRALR